MRMVYTKEAKKTKSRQDKLRGGGGREAETAQRNSVGTLESHPGTLATPGSEFCVVAREGGTKRKQPVLRLCD